MKTNIEERESKQDSQLVGTQKMVTQVNRDREEETGRETDW